MRLHQRLSGHACALLFAVFLLALSPEARAQSTTVQRLGTPSLTAAPGQSVTLAMRFNAVPMAEDYGVFVHLIDSSGNNRAPSSFDHAPPTPTSQWSGAIAYNRTVTLPTEVDTERVDARYTDGILTLTLPKAEEAKPRQIAVRT